MNTAEVAIEHVLTGVLALCAFALPFARWYGFNGMGLSTEAVVGVLGLAYLFGVVFDKIADTLLEPFEQRLRLRLARKRLHEHRGCPGENAFPQDALEYALRRDGGGPLAWMDSLRSRIRTSRGLAVLGLPAALGLALYQTTPEDWSPSGQSFRALFPHLAIALNLLFIAMSLSRSMWPKGLKIPRTEELAGDSTGREKALGRSRWLVPIHACPYVLMEATSVAALVIIACTLSDRCAVLAAAGVVAVGLALCVWHHITWTYMKFVAQGLPTDVR